MEVGASGWHGPYAPRDAMEERESGIVSATIRFHFTEVLTVKETENKKRAATPNLVQVRTGVFLFLLYYGIFFCALHILCILLLYSAFCSPIFQEIYTLCKKEPAAN